MNERIQISWLLYNTQNWFRLNDPGIYAKNSTRTRASEIILNFLVLRSHLYPKLPFPPTYILCSYDYSSFIRAATKF
jgi:hypothetical protein